MRTDNFGQIILNEMDLCSIYMRDPTVKLRGAIVDKEIHFDPTLDLADTPVLKFFKEENLDIEDFDSNNHAFWYMPEEYKNMDIAEWTLLQCETDAQRQRVGEELLLYLERNLFPLLQYLKYLVDTMRNNSIVWGVGRGSSVCSYVLFLIGVHKIDSMYYDLDIKDFLR